MLDPMLETHYDIPDIYVRRWASACHLSAVVLFFLPIAPIVLPAVIWFLKRDEHFYIDEQGRESVNFQISMTLYAGIVGVLLLVLKWVFLGYLFLWVPVLIHIAQIMLALVGALRAYDGEKFRYPFTIPFIAPIEGEDIH
jgi:uncharacterized protein